MASHSEATQVTVQAARGERPETDVGAGRQRPLPVRFGGRALVLLAAALAVGVDVSYLVSKTPTLLFTDDNADIVYPLYEFALGELREGRIPFYQPYLWAGTRLLGDPNFQINVLQLAVGWLGGTDLAFKLTDIMYIVERIVALLGMFALIGAASPQTGRAVRLLLSLAYIFSSGYQIAGMFTSTAVHFATVPWVLYFLATSKFRPTHWTLLALVSLLTVQFSYGQLQFSVYTVWLTLSFVLLGIGRSERWRTLLILAVAGVLAAGISAFYLLPMADNLFLSTAGQEGRTAAELSASDRYTKLVPLFYLPRLFAPGIFDSFGQRWWPIWGYSWTTLEAYSAFQGTIIGLTAFFGLFLRSVPLYWRLLFVFLIATVAHPALLDIPYLLNLGTSIPYGRQTLLLALVIPIIVAFVLRAVATDARIAWRLAAWFGLWVLIFVSVVATQFPFWYVQSAFELIKDTFPHLYRPDAAKEFYAAHGEDLRLSLVRPAVYGGIGAFLALGTALAWRSGALRVRHLVPAACMLIAAVSLWEAVTSYWVASRRPGAINSPPSIGLAHPIERVLAEAGARPDGRPIRYRIHLDIYFKEHRDGADLVRRLIGARPKDNRFRLLPNFLASQGFPVTSGYSSVIPQAKIYTEWMRWAPAHPPMERALGDRAVLRPALLQAFGIKWVLRHQPPLTEKLKGRPDYSQDPWEKRFLARSRLLYQDEAYRLFEYNEPSPLIHVPARVAFGKHPVTTLGALEDPNEDWIPTAALAFRELEGLVPELQARIATERKTLTIRQSGSVYAIEGEPGRWTKFTVDADDAAVVLLGVKYDKWWRVRVNGNPAPLIRANGLFAATQVAKGRSTVEVELRPWSASIGLGITAITFLGALAAFFVALRRGRARRTA